MSAPGISTRAARMVGEPSHLVEAHTTAVADPFDPQRNPQGYVNLGTAENELVSDLLLPRLRAAREVVASDTHYGSLHGTDEFRSAVADLLTSHAGRPVDGSRLVAMSGTSAVLDALAYALCEEGEAVVVPAPFYGGFDVDFTARARARLVPAPLSSGDGFALSARAVTDAVEQARAAGTTVPAVALISPHNPTGRVYAADALREVVDATRALGVHLVVDEIYARSVFGDVVFTSALSFEDEHVHVVWGFAKDFALSGYKVGLLHTRHDDVLAAVTAQAYLSPVSNDVQRTLVGLLGDARWVADFTAESARRLAVSHALVVDRLAELGVETAGAQAGVFAWIDLRAQLTEQTWAAERALWSKLFDDAHINIAAGELFHGDEPGWFRITHAADPVHVTEALDRLGRVLAHDE
ncbi:aminotransferase class I/II-fold pyridoxal phosphate-dependent enzyme [Luteipulveratus halotolerans]|uniref:Aminotransferase class I/classII large domain-containing protein n=1 Tax=Luteipulveratus halotolerans TaxID=1631356 RepID=A0A0L6CK46_9MICO|nr:aminotransferase class I/II-fold pyridoxal phosphate-dependent enzyme [Luteipulveratus halotolerans]KNX38152.1 hypothetical protein VV01_14965 [Luteipulveratus halotolerans]